MRRPGNFPQPESIGVRLTGCVGVKDAQHVGLGLHVHDWHILVGAKDRRTAADGISDTSVLTGCGQWQPGGSTAVNEESVELVSQRLYAVVVRHHRKC